MILPAPAINMVSHLRGRGLGFLSGAETCSGWQWSWCALRSWEKNRACAINSPSALLGNSPLGSATQFFGNFRRHAPGLFHLTGFEADGSDARMTAAAVALADGGEIMPRFDRRPGVRTDGNLGPETGRAHRHRVNSLRIDVVRDELVVALEIESSQIEGDYAALFVRLIPDNAQRFQMPR